MKNVVLGLVVAFLFSNSSYAQHSEGPDLAKEYAKAVGTYSGIVTTEDGKTYYAADLRVWLTSFTDVNSESGYRQTVPVLAGLLTVHINVNHTLTESFATGSFNADYGKLELYQLSGLPSVDAFLAKDGKLTGKLNSGATTDNLNLTRVKN